MARGRTNEDLTTLQMALVGYQIERQKIEEKIQSLQKQLKGSRGAALPASGEKKAAVKRFLSPAARKRIAAAQKKRWAEHRKRQAAAGKEE